MKNYISLLIVFVVIISCKHDKDEINPINQPQIVLLDSFPLSVGNHWKYYTESHITDSIGAHVTDEYFDSYWTVISDTIINGINSAKILQLDSNYDGTTHLAYSYYANRPDGFYGMAVENNGSLFFLKTRDNHSWDHFNLFGLSGNQTSNTDTVEVPDTSLWLLKFPTNLNDIWFSYEYNAPVPDIIKRKWIGYSTVTTNAGTFNCIKLQMFWDYDNNNQPDSGYSNVYQYFSTKGLIQEELNGLVTFGGGGGIDSLHRITKLVQVNF